MTKPLNYFSILVFTVLSFTCSAKIDSNKIRPYKFIELNVGGTFPTGSFATGTGLTIGGNTGFTTNLMAACPIKEYLGGMLVCSYGGNELSISAINNATTYTTIPQKGYLSACFIEKNLLIGVYYMVPGDNKASIDIRVLAGPLFLTVPGTVASSGDVVTGQTNASIPAVNTQFAGITAFAFDVGVSLRSTLGKRLLMSLNLDYYNASTSGQKLVTSQQSPYNSSVTVTTFPFSSIIFFTPTFGLGYKLGK